MKFFHETGAVLGWFFRILGVFFRVRPATTFVLVAAASLSPVMSILASFLPLKALLLAASPTVPSYFPFVGAAEKEWWIALFGGGAIVAYFMILALDALVRKLAEVGSLDVLEGANDLAIMYDRRVHAQTYYERISRTLANMLLATALLLVLAFINPLVFYVVSGMCIAAFLFTAILWSATASGSGRYGGSVLLNEKLSGYLGTLSSLTFFSGFALLLYPYLKGAGVNVLISILAFLVLRQFLRHLSDAIRDSTGLWRRRIEINPLIFPDHKLRVTGKEKDKQLHEMFSRERRETLVTEALREKGFDVSDVDVLWFDPVTPPVNLFDVQLKSNGKLNHYQMQVFPGANSHELVSEDFLFDLIPREELLAPPLLARFQHGPYEIQICAAGEPITLRRYNSLLPAIKQKLWRVKPPESLVKAFLRSHSVLYDRIDPGMIGRMELAVDTDEDRANLEGMNDRLPEIQRLLRQLPLVIVNPQLGPRNVMEIPGGYYVMSWGRWALEPVGTMLSNNVGEEEMQELVDALRAGRDDVGEWLSTHHLVLAQQVWMLELSLIRGSYREALVMVRKILENPALQNPRDPDVLQPAASG